MKVGILLDHHCQVDAKKQTMVVDGLRGSKPQNNTKKSLEIRFRVSNETSNSNLMANKVPKLNQF